MIRNIRALDLVRVFGSRSNADESERLIRVIERTKFAMLPYSWSRSDEARGLVLGRLGRGADYMISTLITNVRFPNTRRGISFTDNVHVYRLAIQSSGIMRHLICSFLNCTER